jgi:hypothetical protein
LHAVFADPIAFRREISPNQSRRGRAYTAEEKATEESVAAATVILNYNLDVPR